MTAAVASGGWHGGLRKALGVLVVACLAGCAGMQTPWDRGRAAVAEAQATRRATLLALDHWTLDGRVAVQRGSEGGTAQLRWQQRGEAFDLRIMAPLGRGTYQLHGDGARVTLVAPDGRQYEADRIETLMAQHLNWSLPVAGAQYWVRGVPAPAPPATDVIFDETGRMTDCAQAGWRVSVLDYDAATTPELPRKLFLAADDVKIRIAITQWTLAP